jgi:hypothetical protein
MLLRMVVSLVLSVSTFVGSILGIGNGMVLVVHEDGHVHVENAHLRHADEHAAGAGHGSHDYGHDGDHAPLHAAIASDVDTGSTRPAKERHDPATARIIALPVLPIAFAAPVPSLGMPRVDRHRFDDLLGVIALRESTCLRSVVLVV